MENVEGKGPALTADEKKAVRKKKLDFDLHVNLIMRNVGEPKNAAVFRAYCEGADGLQERLTPAAATVAAPVKKQA